MNSVQTKITKKNAKLLINTESNKSQNPQNTLVYSMISASRKKDNAYSTSIGNLIATWLKIPHILN